MPPVATVVGALCQVTACSDSCLLAPRLMSNTLWGFLLLNLQCQGSIQV